MNRSGSATHFWLRQSLGAYAKSRRAIAQIPAAIEPQTMSRWVEAHGLEGLFYQAQDAGGGLAAVLPRWRHKAMAELLANLRALKATVQLFGLLDQAGIEAVAMRGVVLANRDYASPEERSMRDADILLRADARSAVLHTLELAGHRPSERLRSQEVYTIDGVALELHWSLLTAKRYRGCIDEAEWLRQRSPLHTPDGRLYALPLEYELIGLVVHAFIHHELGILKQLLDIALFMNDEKLDWPWIAKWCRGNHLSRMFALTLHLVNELFFLEAKAFSRHFPLSSPASSGARRVQAWIDPFFSRAGLGNYLQLKGNMLHAAETPERWFRQAIGFFSASELRDIRRRYRSKHSFRSA